MKEELGVVANKPVSCGACGGNLVAIRGRYPGSESRYVCSTCDHERLEHINEISSPNYGMAGAVNEVSPRQLIIQAVDGTGRKP